MATYVLSDEIQVLGRAGEQGDVAVSVDVTAWQTEYPDGEGAVLCTRPDGTEIPLTATVTGTTMTATLTEACMSRPGVLQFTATWAQSGTLLLSATYKGLILSTSDGRGDPPDEPGTPEWATEIFVRAEQIDAALDAALQMEQYAEDAAEAQTAAEAAQGAAEEAQEYAEAARDRAITAADTVTPATAAETLTYLGIS